MTWKSDREHLRNLLREGPKSPLFATLFCALVSHMRGKVHMHFFKKYEGGWRSMSVALRRQKPEGPISEKLSAAYGEYAKEWYGCSVIENLEDQAEWIRGYGSSVLLSPELEAIRDRVLSGKWVSEEDRKIAVELDHAPIG